MTMTSNAALVAAGNALLAHIAKNTIPYKDGGMTLENMDCQGLVEYCLIQAGVPKSECNLAGSNAHWRNAIWRGTPEELIKVLGAVPAGACPCIHNYDGGEVARGYHDDYGNCSHIGLYLGNKISIAASASRKKVIQSNFKGKTVPNGGWNAVILLPWVNYGLTDAQKLALGITATVDGEMVTATVTASGPVDTSNFYTVKIPCKGGAVERLQSWLNELGYSLNVDHDFGPATETAVKDFQSKKGLKADGIVGRNTWKALAQALYDQVAEVQG